MIPVDSLLYKIDQKLNKLSTNDHQQIPLEDKILALNEAQIKLIKQKLDGPTTPEGLGLDSFKKRYEDLQKLVESYEDHPLDVVLTNAQLNKWTASLANITPAYMFYIDAYAIADKGRCTGRKLWMNKELGKHSDLNMLLNNVHYKPSFEYQETFCIISSDQISIYTDGSFTPTKIYLSYLRYPKYIDKSGYVKLDGTNSSDQDCELKNYLEDELVDLAVENLAMYIQDIAALQSSELRIKQSE